MKRTIILAAVFLPSASVAADTCFSAGFGPYGAQVPAWALVMNPPVAKTTVLVSAPVAVKKGLVIAKQDYTMAPVTRYLTADIVLMDEKGRSLSKAVPLAAGSSITLWRGAEGDRECSIGWQNGLFGGATGDGHYRWICLEDRNKDGKYDNGWRPRTGNMGLSYSRQDMPISPEVGWSETPIAAPEKASGSGGPLDAYPASRSIEISGISNKSVQIWYWGVGVGRRKENRIELPIDKQGSVTLGGIIITLTPTGKGKAMVSASGEFEPQAITANCNGSNHRIGDFDSRVMFSFPNW